MSEDWEETGQESLSLSFLFFSSFFFLFRPQARLTESLEQTSVLVTVNWCIIKDFKVLV